MAFSQGQKTTLAALLGELFRGGHRFSSQGKTLATLAANRTLTKDTRYGKKRHWLAVRLYPGKLGQTLQTINAIKLNQSNYFSDSFSRELANLVCRT